MAELTEAEKKAIQETHDTVIQLKTILIGVNGDEGLVGEIKDLHRNHNKLKQSFWTLVGILVGSGFIGGGLWGLLK